MRFFNIFRRKPRKSFMDELEEKTKVIREKNRIWSIEFNKNGDTFKKAKELERSDPYKAIELYESIKNTNYGNFDTLSRLIILYRKTKQKDKEIQHIKFKIEELQHREFYRLEFVLSKYPEESEYIKECYETGKDCFLPNGSVINFKRKIINLQSKLKGYGFS